MRKGELTRHAILERATALASRHGLEGVTIGRLSRELRLSKSGLFAHFRSKDAMQVQVLRFAGERFVEQVVRPSLEAARGEPRVRELLERWLAWERSRTVPGGCLFVAAAVELDDRPGEARDELVRLQRDWLDFIATCCRKAMSEEHFAPTTDPDQFAHDLNAIMLGYHQASRLLHDPAAEPLARAAFEARLAAARARPPVSRRRSARVARGRSTAAERRAS